MKLIAVGTNHAHSPLELRERLFFRSSRIYDATAFLKEAPALKGAVILSTCNRSEIYASTENAGEGTKAIEAFISMYHEIGRQSLLPFLYRYENRKAMAHLLSVACGLDSMILGETQVLGQVRASFFKAAECGFVDTFLKEVFYSAISFARRVHAETKISEGKVSVGSVAVDFIRERIGPLLDKRILIIGAGKVTELLLRYLKKEGARLVFVANKTYEHARSLADRIGADAVRFNRLREFIAGSDVLITATASPHFVVKKHAVEDAITGRQRPEGMPLLIIDLALPRDVEPEAGRIEGVELFSLDDLGAVIRRNLDRRSAAAQGIRAMIDGESGVLWQELTGSEQERALLR